MKKTLQELAELLGGTLVGDGDTVITGLNNISGARAGDLIFAVDPHIDEARDSRASAVLLIEGAEDFQKPVIFVQDPKASFAKLLALFTPSLEHPAGVSELAHIGEGAKVAPSAKILPYAVVDAHAQIGENVLLYPHTYIGQHASIGDGTVIHAGAVVREHCRIGKRCVIQNGAVIGADGFGFTTSNGVHTKVPQVGNVVLEDDVEVGAQVGIDRAAMGSTIIGKGTKIDNLVHVGHNCNIGENNLLVAQTGISGSTSTGENVTFGGQTGVVGHIHIGARSTYAARSGIIADMPEGYFGAGFPVQTHQEWLRMQAAMRRLPELMKKIKTLEKELEKR